MKQFLDIPLELRMAGLFVVGVWLGIWLNLGIYRLAFFPRAISPWSAPLPSALRRRWYDRLPVLGWLGLRREAALHGSGFWIRPIAIELFTGALVAALYWWEVGERALLSPAMRLFLDQPQNAAARLEAFNTLHWEFFAHVCLIGLMMVASFIDLDEKTIPDAITVPGTLLGLALTALVPRSLLPTVTAGAAGAGAIPIPKLEFLTFASPNPWPWPGELKGMPHSHSAILGLVCLWIWCIGLMPRIWRTRHGLRVAVAIFTARLVRDPVSKWLLAMGAVLSIPLVLTWRHGPPHWQGLLTALVGLAAGGGIVWVVRIVGTAILGREAMGFGDVTLMAMIGSFVGWQACLIIFFLAPFAGAVIGVTQWILSRDGEIRYGPFLCLATLVVVVRWEPIWEHFHGLFEIGWFIPAVMACCLLLMMPLLWIVRAIGDWARGS